MWRTSTSRPALLALAAAALALPAAAMARDFDDLTCRNGLFADEPPFQLARVSGQNRAFFLGDLNGCPEASECQLPRQPFVVPGDVVLVSKLLPGHACAYYPNNAGGTAGYLPLGQLEFIEVPTAPGDDGWIGSWTDRASADFTIGLSREGPRVDGNAVWLGAVLPSGDRVIHDGQISGALTIFGNRAHYDDGYCEVDFTLLGDFLIAGDNRGCGGVNVTFSSVYTRAAD